MQAAASRSAYSLLSVIWIQVRNSPNWQIQLFPGCYQFITLEAAFSFEYLFATMSLNVTLWSVSRLYRKVICIFMSWFDDNYKNYLEIFIHKYGTCKETAAGGYWVLFLQ